MMLRSGGRRAVPSAPRTLPSQLRSCSVAARWGHRPTKRGLGGLAKVPGTLVVLMGLRNIQAIAATLIAHGRPPDTPVAIVSRGTTGRQQTVVGTLDTIAELASRRGHQPARRDGDRRGGEPAGAVELV